MSASARTSSLAAYRSTAAIGGVAASDPHGLIVMLLDGALDRIASARGCMNNGAQAEKSALIHRTVSIVFELRGSLNLADGGELATNMADLYDYLCRRLMTASTSNRADILDEVASLLREIRSAWILIPVEARALRRS
jgi:flagellar protein FliS